MSLREKIYDQVWNTYQEYKVIADRENGLKFELFPSGIIRHYKLLHKLLVEYRKMDDFAIFDIADFFADLSMEKYLEHLHGLKILKTGMVIAFINSEFIEKHRKYLVELDSQNGIQRFQLIGEDKMILHLVNSQKEQLKILVDYKMLEPELITTTYFFLIGHANGFPPGYQIGSGKLYHFQQLPKLVQESWRFWKVASKHVKLEEVETKYDKEKKYRAIVPADINPDEGGEYEENWFIKMQITSFGSYSEQRKALSTINRIVSIIRLFCSTPDFYGPFYAAEINAPWDYYFNSNGDVDWDEKSEIPRDQLGAVNFVNTDKFLLDFIRIASFDNYISIINKIIEKDEIKRTDLENAIINAIDIYGTINKNTHLNVNFMLCIIALESLIMNGKHENIGYKLSERIALLVGDSKEWLQYCLMEEKIDSISDSNSLPIARIILNKTISELYNKRSGFAHTGGKRSGISYDDYILAYRILKLVLMKVMVLYNSIGLLSREPDGRTPNRSLEEYIKGLKFGYGFDQL